MDRIGELSTRLILSLLDRPITNYNFVVIFFLMLSRKSWTEGEWNWEVLNMLETTPLKLLIWPLRIISLFLPLIVRATSFPDRNLLYILIALYTVFVTSMMLGTNVALHCSIFPEFCYEGSEGGAVERSFFTKIAYGVFQLIITVNMIMAIWFFKSILEPVKKAMLHLLKYIRKNFFTLLGTANFVLLVAHYDMQRFVIYLMLAQMLWKRLSDYLLINPVLDFRTYEIPLLLEGSNEHAENPWTYRYAFGHISGRYQLLEVIAAGDEEDDLEYAM